MTNTMIAYNKHQCAFHFHCRNSIAMIKVFMICRNHFKHIITHDFNCIKTLRHFFHNDCSWQTSMDNLFSFLCRIVLELHVSSWDTNVIKSDITLDMLHGSNCNKSIKHFLPWLSLIVNINAQFIFFALQKFHSNENVLIKMCHQIRYHFRNIITWF